MGLFFGASTLVRKWLAKMTKKKWPFQKRRAGGVGVGRIGTWVQSQGAVHSPMGDLHVLAPTPSGPLVQNAGNSSPPLKL